MVEQEHGVCCGRLKKSVIAGVMEMGRKKAKKSLQKIHDRGPPVHRIRLFLLAASEQLPKHTLIYPAAGWFEWAKGVLRTP